ADEAAAAASGGGASGGAADVWVSPCGAASAGSAASCGVVAGWASGATTGGLSDSRCQTKSAPSKSAAPRAHESQRREDEGLPTLRGAVTPVAPVSPARGWVTVIRATGAWGGGDGVGSGEGVEGRVEGVSKGGMSSSSASAASCA